MRSRIVVALVVSACVGLVAACGSDGSSPTSPSASGLNLAGIWTGTIGGVTEQDGARATWTAIQSGSSASGPFTAVFDDDGGGDTVTINGTMTGTVSGAELTSATIAFAAGSIPISPGCSFTGTGTQAITASSIAGTMTMAFAAPCIGDTVSQTPTDTFRLSLTK